MNINVIQADNSQTFDYLTFPEQNPANQYYIQQQLAQFSNALTETGKQFIEASRAIYDKVNDSNAVRAAKVAIRMAKGIFHPNAIVPLETLDDIRTAQPVMQRYIMANPDIRGYYHRQQCDGYSDTYIDNEPKRIGKDHYDYRRVTDGMIQDNVGVNDDDYSWSSINYYEDLLEGDRDLVFQEKKDIMSTWNVMKMFIEANEDPTNIFSGELGV